MIEEPKNVQVEFHPAINISINSLVPLLRDLNTGIRQSTKSVIESMESLARSNDRHSYAMKWLTAGLVAVALAQACFTYAQYKVGETSIDMQREANSIERSRWEYEMTRNDRLEARDVEWRRVDLQRNNK